MPFTTHGKHKDELLVYSKAKLLNISSERRTSTSYNSYGNTNINPTAYRGGRPIAFQATSNASTYPSTNTTTVYWISVRLADIVYTGEYKAKWRWSFEPDWVIGDLVSVRLSENGKQLYIKKSNGDELKTKVVRKERA